jgi:hypothetical protein
MHVVRERTFFQFAVCVRGLLVTTSFVLFAMTMRAQGAQPPQAGPAAANPGNPAPTNVTNQSNNVLTPMPQLLLQNFFMPSLAEFPGRKGSEALLRFYWPFTVSGVQNIFRIYQPIFIEPLFPHGRDAGLGDTLMFDLVLHKLGKFTVGAGPLLVIPSASHSNMGDGKWHFSIGKDLMPREMITAYAILKKAAANANYAGKRLGGEQNRFIVEGSRTARGYAPQLLGLITFLSPLLT